MKISASGYITLIIVAGFFLIAYLFVAAPLSAENELPLILAAIAGLVAVISKQGKQTTPSQKPRMWHSRRR